MKRYLLCIAGLCVIVSSLFSCGKATQEATLMQGRTLEEQGDYIGALDHYQQMEDPGFRQICSSNLRYLYGDILDALLVQREDPETPAFHYALGKAYADKAESLPQGMEIAPNIAFDSQTYFEKRREFFQQQALKELDTATKMQADYQEAVLLQASLYEERGNPEKAIPFYQHLLSLSPNSPSVASHLGQLLYRQGQTEQGIAFAEQAVRQAPNDPETHFILAALYAEEGEEILAIGHFQQTLCADPHFLETYYRLSQIFLSNGNLIDAERVLRLGVINNPEALSLGLFYAALNSLLNAKEEDDAEQIIRQIEGEVITDETGKVDLSEESPRLQIQYLRLRMKLIQRQRPYWLPCSGEEENPYFDNQLRQTEERIKSLEQLLIAAEQES